MRRQNITRRPDDGQEARRCNPEAEKGNEAVQKGPTGHRHVEKSLFPSQSACCFLGLSGFLSCIIRAAGKELDVLSTMQRRLLNSFTAS